MTSRIHRNPFPAARTSTHTNPFSPEIRDYLKHWVTTGGRIVSYDGDLFIGGRIMGSYSFSVSLKGFTIKKDSNTHRIHITLKYEISGRRVDLGLLVNNMIRSDIEMEATGRLVGEMEHIYRDDISHIETLSGKGIMIHT